MGKDDRPMDGKAMCAARCHCGRRCHKKTGHCWKHRCLRHGNF